MCRRHITFTLVTLLALHGFANITIVEKGILPLSKNSVGIKLFVDLINDDRHTPYEVISKVKKCCLYDTDLVECDGINIYGNHLDTIQPKDRKTFIYVYPTLYQHDLVGYCDIIYNKYRKNKLQVRIPFDTRLKKRNPDLENYIYKRKWKPCKTHDLNPLDNCSPAECDLKYNGQKSYFDAKTNQCKEQQICAEDVDNELPTALYIPESNTCSLADALLTIQDIYNINTGNTVKISVRRSCESDPNLEVISNNSTISQLIYYLHDIVNGKQPPYDNHIRRNVKSVICRDTMSIVTACAMMFAILSCLNIGMWIFSSWGNYSYNDCRRILRKKFAGGRNASRPEDIRQIRSALLHEVINRQIPLEMRHSFLSICERMDKVVCQKKRYRRLDVGSQMSLKRERDSSISSSKNP